MNPYLAIAALACLAYGFFQANKNETARRTERAAIGLFLFVILFLASLCVG